jgi:hypothetical protein
MIYSLIPSSSTHEQNFSLNYKIEFLGNAMMCRRDLSHSFPPGRPPSFFGGEWSRILAQSNGMLGHALQQSHLVCIFEWGIRLASHSVRWPTTIKSLPD